MIYTFMPLIFVLCNHGNLVEYFARSGQFKNLKAGYIVQDPHSPTVNILFEGDKPDPEDVVLESCGNVGG